MPAIPTGLSNNLLELCRPARTTQWLITISARPTAVWAWLTRPTRNMSFTSGTFPDSAARYHEMLALLRSSDLLLPGSTVQHGVEWAGLPARSKPGHFYDCAVKRDWPGTPA